MNWLYNSKFYRWLDADETGKRWEWYGMILIAIALVGYGMIIWWMEI